MKLSIATLMGVLQSGPACGGQMSVISFIEETKTIDRIIRHLELTFEAERPPPPHQQGFLMAAEEKGKYF